MTPTHPELPSALRALATRVEGILDLYLPQAEQAPARLHAAMRYAALGSGKRVRPLLVYATGRALGAALPALDSAAAAVELIHCYSLVHDDLPAMDNDAMRRGRPTCHIAFDPATALLVGDALQSLAFALLAAKDQDSRSAATRLEMLSTLAQAGGSAGMAGGQALDLAAVGQTLGLAELETMHALKTGALIRAAVRLGALAAECGDANVFAALDAYATALGLAFQIRDDILDVEGDTAILGKPQGSDAAQAKPTYASILGVVGARERLEQQSLRASAALAPLGAAADELRALAEFAVLRIK